MNEPTYTQHKILEKLFDNSRFLKNNNANIDVYWELVRMGYATQLITNRQGVDWNFMISEEGIEYLEKIKEREDDTTD